MNADSQLLQLFDDWKAVHHISGKPGYETVTGMVLRVDTEVGKEITIQTDTTKKVIGFDDILEITSKTGVFETDWEMEAP